MPITRVNSFTSLYLTHEFSDDSQCPLYCAIVHPLYCTLVLDACILFPDSFGSFFSLTLRFDIGPSLFASYQFDNDNNKKLPPLV